MKDIIIIGAGPAGMTAALYALRADKSVLLLEKENFGGQITYSPKVENYPGFYYVGRHTSFAFLAAYNDDKDPTTEILRYVNTINAEITRKRQEFNLETVELGSTLAEKRSNQIREALGVLEDRGLISRDSDLYDQAMYGIVNQNVSILKIAYELFKDEYLSKYDGSEKTITKVSGKTAVVPTDFVNVNKQRVWRYFLLLDWWRL